MDIVAVVGSAPEWASAAVAAISLRQSSRTKSFFDELLAAGVTPKVLIETVEQVERFGDLLLEAAHTAGNCSDESRRILLARAFASGVDGDIEIDDLQFFIRTIRDVDPIHMKLLRAIAEHAPVSTQDLERAWPEAAPMLKPMRALLDREGLVEDMSLGTISSYANGQWGLTDYGHRFLNFILESGVEVESIGR